MIDPALGRVVRSTRVSLGSDPVRLVAGSGGVWALDFAGQTLLWTPEARAPQRPLGVRVAPSDLTAGAGSVWIANVDNTVSQIDTTSYLVTGTIHLPDLPLVAIGGATSATAITIGSGALWVSQTRSLDLGVSRVSLKNHRSRLIASGVGGGPVTVGSGSVWVGEHLGPGNGGSVSAEVDRIDPTTGNVTPIPLAVQGANGVGIISAFGAIWYLSGPGTGGTGTLWEIDPGSNAIRDGIPVGSNPTGLAAVGGAIWVAQGASGTILKIDPSTHRITQRVRLGHTVTSIAATNHLWAAVQAL